MTTRKRLLIGGALFALLSSRAALAQSPSYLQGNYTMAPYRPATFSVSYTGITTAASLTDFFVITGSATKTVYLTRIACGGLATADGTGKINLVKRSTADSGGTTITPSGTAGGQLVPHDSNDAAATATVAAYSANPSSLGTLVGIVRSSLISFGLVGATDTNSKDTVWDFANDQRPILRGVAQQLAIGGLGTALPAGAVLTCTASWVEQ